MEEFQDMDLKDQQKIYFEQYIEHLLEGDGYQSPLYENNVDQLYRQIYYSPILTKSMKRELLVKINTTEKQARYLRSVAHLPLDPLYEELNEQEKIDYLKTNGLNYYKAIDETDDQDDSLLLETLQGKDGDKHRIVQCDPDYSLFDGEDFQYKIKTEKIKSYNDLYLWDKRDQPHKAWCFTRDEVKNWWGGGQKQDFPFLQKSPNDKMKRAKTPREMWWKRHDQGEAFDHKQDRIKDLLKWISKTKEYRHEGFDFLNMDNKDRYLEYKQPENRGPRKYLNIEDLNDRHKKNVNDYRESYLYRLIFG